jgi:hypothetical protein
MRHWQQKIGNLMQRRSLDVSRPPVRNLWGTAAFAFMCWWAAGCHAADIYSETRDNQDSTSTCWVYILGKLEAGDDDAFRNEVTGVIKKDASFRLFIFIPQVATSTLL